MGTKSAAREQVRAAVQAAHENGAREASRRVGSSSAAGARAAVGLPEGLRASVERLSGQAMDDVEVHRDSSQPGRVRADAFTRGASIHLAPGQERHLPHEAWHVVQQKQGRVRPTLRENGFAVNDDAVLEREADVMGARAVRMAGRSVTGSGSGPRGSGRARAEPGGDLAGAAQPIQRAIHFERPTHGLGAEATDDEVLLAIHPFVRVDELSRDVRMDLADTLNEFDGDDRHFRDLPQLMQALEAELREDYGDIDISVPIEALRDPIRVDAVAGERVYLTIKGLINCVGVVIQVFPPSKTRASAIVGGHFVTPEMLDTDTGTLTGAGSAFIAAIKQLLGDACPDNVEMNLYARKPVGRTSRPREEAQQAAEAIKKALGVYSRIDEVSGDVNAQSE